MIEQRLTNADVDAHIGRRVRARRLEVGMSQEQLADLLGVTFQQIQKYEKGVNRVAASRLYDMTNALDVEITYFFAGLPKP
jgi:transcriptional regulator with XRE-family HTH domain